jgi:hypothetical protein
VYLFNTDVLVDALIVVFDTAIVAVGTPVLAATVVTVSVFAASAPSVPRGVAVNVDVDGLAARGYQYETIDQLAIEHLMGL